MWAMARAIVSSIVTQIGHRHTTWIIHIQDISPYIRARARTHTHTHTHTPKNSTHFIPQMRISRFEHDIVSACKRETLILDQYLHFSVQSVEVTAPWLIIRGFPFKGNNSWTHLRCYVFRARKPCWTDNLLPQVQDSDGQSHLKHFDEESRDYLPCNSRENKSEDDCESTDDGFDRFTDHQVHLSTSHQWLCSSCMTSVIFSSY